MEDELLFIVEQIFLMAASTGYVGTIGSLQSSEKKYSMIVLLEDGLGIKHYLFNKITSKRKLVGATSLDLVVPSEDFLSAVSKCVSGDLEVQDKFKDHISSNIKQMTIEESVRFIYDEIRERRNGTQEG